MPCSPGPPSSWVPHHSAHPTAWQTPPAPSRAAPWLSPSRPGPRCPVVCPLATGRGASEGHVPGLRAGARGRSYGSNLKIVSTSSGRSERWQCCRQGCAALYLPGTTALLALVPYQPVLALCPALALAASGSGRGFVSNEPQGPPLKCPRGWVGGTGLPAAPSTAAGKLGKSRGSISPARENVCAGWERP